MMGLCSWGLPATTHGFPQVPALLGLLFLAQAWSLPEPRASLAAQGTQSSLWTPARQTAKLVTERLRSGE